ncbi:single-strand DNA-binding protein [Micromonospora haikouensis]|uniref:Single-stranded DNA-binding protein n=1 Tax=Micromonospora haikouensis TaxID=686309 RepID=A0A1C4WFP3_9ACTN|nr:single-strand DNA-binding protein [Micromonospora haikouensis]
MFDTYVTVVGNVLTAPEWRRTTQSGTLVANFKVASTARRLDRGSGRWVDGNSLRVRVNCWRKLAEGVAASVMVGDPVVVAGRLYTRDWTDDAGNHRTVYELEAVAVGHDLSRGRGRFLRNRPNVATSTVEDAEAESRVHGEPTERVPRGQAPSGPEGRPYDEDFEPDDFAPARASFDPRGLDELDERDDLDDGSGDDDGLGEDDGFDASGGIGGFGGKDGDGGFRGNGGLGEDGGIGGGAGADGALGSGGSGGAGRPFGGVDAFGDDEELTGAGVAGAGPSPSGGPLPSPSGGPLGLSGHDELSAGAGSDGSAPSGQEVGEEAGGGTDGVTPTRRGRRGRGRVGAPA